jgi:hypothetical protein
LSERNPWSLINPLVLSALTIAVVAFWVLVDLHGWDYYSTPLRIRGYAAPHRVLKPSGSVAHSLGVVGLAMLLLPVAYAVRKRWALLARAGTLRGWLEAHILCGIVGPVLVTFHTSFRFNGIISVAYWSMVAVVLSGFVGRYLFVRMPKTIRGTELTHDEIQARAEHLKRQLDAGSLQSGLLDRVHEAERNLEPAAVGATFGPIVVWSRLRGLRSELREAGVDRHLAADVTGAIAERVTLIRKLAHLNRTRRLFAMWHVFHQPLVYVMLTIAALHVGIAIYLGYSLW